MLLQKLRDKGLIHPPTWIPDNTVILTIMGSQSYGCHTEDSDMDIYGVAIPPKDQIFPPGEIRYFGYQTPPIKTWVEHHVLDTDALAGNGREYDFSVYGIVKYFDICMGCNPNCIDSLFTPQNCVIHSTQVGDMIRENRKLFLSKACFQTFKNYAYSQTRKIATKSHKGLDELRDFEEKHNLPKEIPFEDVEGAFNAIREVNGQKGVFLKKYLNEFNFGKKLLNYMYGRKNIKTKIHDDPFPTLNDAEIRKYYNLYLIAKEGSKRAEKVKTAGFDLKFAMNLVRLLNECEQILIDYDLDLQKNNEQLKAIRRGEISEQEIMAWADAKKLQLEEAYHKSTIPERPREQEIKVLLLRCLEHHYGNLGNIIQIPERHENLLREIKSMISKAGI